MKKQIVNFIILFVVLSTSVAHSDDRLHRYFLTLSSPIEDDDEARNNALRRLVKAGEDAVSVALEYIDRKSLEKREAIERLVLAVGEPAVNPLTHILTRPNDEEAAFAAYLLGEIGSPKASVPLTLAARSSSDRLRAAALGALGNCGDSLSLPVLVDALSDSNPVIRRNSASSIGQIAHSSKVVSSLLPLLSDSSAFVRYSAGEAIARIGDENTLELLKARLDESVTDEFERFHIIEIIGMFRDTASIPLLLDLLEDPSYLNRGFACQALGNFRGNYRVANALKRARNDASDFVRMMAEQSLMAIRLP